MTEQIAAVEKAVEAKPAKPAKREDQSRKAPTPRRARQQLSRPALNQKLELRSLQAQRVVDRSFSRVSVSLYSIDVILQIIGDPNHVGEVEDIIVGMIEKVNDDLLLGQEQTRKLMSDNGITDVPNYTEPKEYNIEITSPQIASFANLLVMLDGLIGQIDALWLHSAFTNRQRSEATFQWQQRLVRLAGRIIGIEKQARLSAYNKGKKDEVDKEAPEIATEDAEIEEVSNEKVKPGVV